jgi:hypothetical protein
MHGDLRGHQLFDRFGVSRAPADPRIAFQHARHLIRTRPAARRLHAVRDEDEMTIAHGLIREEFGGSLQGFGGTRAAAAPEFRAQGVRRRVAVNRPGLEQGYLAIKLHDGHRVARAQLREKTERGLARRARALRRIQLAARREHQHDARRNPLYAAHLLLHVVFEHDDVVEFERRIKPPVLVARKDGQAHFFRIDFDLIFGGRRRRDDPTRLRVQIRRQGKEEKNGERPKDVATCVHKINSNCRARANSCAYSML